MRNHGVPRPFASFVSSLVTCFTKRPGTPFTLPRWFLRHGESKDAVDDDRCGGAESAVRGGGEPAGNEDSVGQVWQERFYDFNVWSDKKEREKLRYLHRNPVMRGTGGPGVVSTANP